MNSKQYYETVDLEKIAEESGCIPVTIHYFKGSVDVFLRPVDLSELIRSTFCGAEVGWL
jgi:hypothetical protein